MGQSWPGDLSPQVCPQVQHIGGSQCGGRQSRQLSTGVSSQGRVTSAISELKPLLPFSGPLHRCLQGGQTVEEAGGQGGRRHATCGQGLGGNGQEKDSDSHLEKYL